MKYNYEDNKKCFICKDKKIRNGWLGTDKYLSWVPWTVKGEYSRKHSMELLKHIPSLHDSPPSPPSNSPLQLPPPTPHSYYGWLTTRSD